MKQFASLAGFLLILCGLMACNHNKKIVEDGWENVPNQVIVLLNPKTDVRKLENNFSTYQLKSKGRSSRSENKHVCTFNEDLVTAEELIQKLKESPLVLEANPMRVKQ